MLQNFKFVLFCLIPIDGYDEGILGGDASQCVMTSASDVKDVKNGRALLTGVGASHCTNKT